MSRASRPDAPRQPHRQRLPDAGPRDAATAPGPGRRAALTLALAAALLRPARAAAGGGGPLRADPTVPLRGPAAAPGALVWAHPYYVDGDPPPALPFLGRLTGPAGWDLWRLDRAPRRDPLEPAVAALAEGTAALRASGYGQVVVVGESRGAFIGVMALRQPRLADALLALAPAAHGTRPERRAQALADWRAALAAMAPDAVRRAGLVLFTGDPYDPDPPARAEAFAEAMRAHAVPALLIDRPEAPTGHGGAWDPGFDARFGACITAWLASAAGGSCAGARPVAAR